MSYAIPFNNPDHESLQHPLEELQACREESQHFLSEVCQHLEQLCNDLTCRHKTNNSTDATRRVDPLPQNIGPSNQSQLQKILDALETQRLDLHDTNNVVQKQLNSFSTQLAGFNQDTKIHIDQLAAAYKEDIPPQTQDDQLRLELESRLNQTEQRNALLEQERNELEADLETVRNRAAEMAETLVEQKRASEEQQQRWDSELKRIRRVLEGMTTLLTQKNAGCSATDTLPHTATASEATDDRILDNVLSQFEMLRKDIAQRQAETT